MIEPVEFNRWYEQGDLHYLFAPFGRGTNAIVRGESDRVAAFVHKLASQYSPQRELYTKEKIEGIIAGVLETGEPETREALTFFDDRIRLISRLDHRYCLQGGPLYGSARHIEVNHNEQYGGRYPVEGDISSLNSRASMIYKVLNALKGNHA